MDFRYVVFHPFLDEILVGKIKYCSQEGVYGERGLLWGDEAVLLKCVLF